MFTECQLKRSTQYNLVQGLCGVPDVPHAVNMSVVAEGSGVGVTKEPPVGTKRVTNVTSLVQAYGASNVCFQIKLTDCVQVVWETILAHGKLFVEIPTGVLPEGSKER